MKRILIVGGDGLIGSALVSRWRQAGREAFFTTRRAGSMDSHALPLNLAEYAGDFPLPKDCAAAVICAGMTNQDFCRRNPAPTRFVNVDQTLRLAGKLVSAGCFVTFLSTSLVFDGSKPLRRASEPTNPQTEYGRQKAATEAGLSQHGQRCAVIRLAKVVHGKLAVFQSWRDQLSQGRVIQPFSDYMCAPVSLAQTVQAIHAVTEREEGGIWQLSPSEDLSYSDIARLLALHLAADPNLVSPTPTPPGKLEHLPRFTTLDDSRLVQTFGWKMPPARAIIEQAIKEMETSGANAP